MNAPVRHLCLVGVCLFASLVAAAGVAWGCVPTARTAVAPSSGPAGLQATMTGDGFPPEAATVDIYLDSRTGTLLKENHPMTSATNGDKAFSVQLTMPTTVGAHLLIPVPRNSSDVDVGGGSTGGAGPPAAVFQVTDPSLSLSPAFGAPGTRATVTGKAFRQGTVAIRWDSAAGQQLGSATATGAGFTFSKQITIPNVPVGEHSVLGVPFGDPSDSASATFRVTAPSPFGPTNPLDSMEDSAGPAIAGAALTRENRAKRVSKRGVVTLFCGSYDEDGVTGTCGAKSARKLSVARLGASRKAVLTLSAKSFKAPRAKPVKLRFRLKRSAMRMLRKARRVRMRGRVEARDAKGNRSSVPFRFTLMSPKGG